MLKKREFLHHFYHALEYLVIKRDKGIGGGLRIKFEDLPNSDDDQMLKTTKCK